jgi:hypothetical protein
MIVTQTATEAKKAIDVASTTTVRNAQSAKDLLVKQEQVDMSVAQQATEAKKALDIVSTTSVRDVQSTKDAALKTAQTSVATNQASDLTNQSTNRSAAQATAESTAAKQRLLLVSQETTDNKKAADLVSTSSVRNAQSTADAALKSAQTSLADAKTTTESNQQSLIDAQTSTESNRQTDLTSSSDLKDAQKNTEGNKQTDLTSSSALKDAQTLQTTTKTISDKLTNREQLFAAEQKVLSEKITNGEEINQYIWEVDYIGSVGITYTYTTIQNLTENDVTALLNYDPHIPSGVVNSIVLNQIIHINTKGVSAAGTSIEKISKEVDLLNQKTITEFAQTQQTTKIAPNSASITGRQSTLFEQQAAGFEWDANNTHNKNLVDLQKMKMNVSGFISPSADGTDGDGIVFDIIDPTHTNHS